MEYAAFGHAHRSRTHVEFLRNHLRGLTFHDHKPKCAPGTLLKLGLDQLQRLAEEKVIAFVRLQGLASGAAVGQSGPPGLGLAASSGLRLAVVDAEMIVDFIPGNGAQPAAKGVSRPVAVEIADVRGNRLNTS